MPRAPDASADAAAVPRGILGWSGREIGVALWSSFLAASLATLLFFATFDPVDLYDDAEILREAFANRVTGYTLGFFFFWSLTLLASLLAIYLLRDASTALRVPPPPNEP